ncbi:MAG TPA: energy-coupling factor transporter transmembrane component T [Pseudolysinimonas sp.]|jgi:energy-coupling factor transport system permease protein|nr:ecfT [Schumannella sp.]HEV7741094.1 energy-coupling factor transporter transmembrane component T [Pseudolysinimonas sp.]
MSTLYLDRESPVHRFNPITKLVGVVAIIMLVFALPYWWAPLAILIVVVVPAALLARVGGRLLLIGGAILVPLLVVVTIGQGFFNSRGETVLFSLGPFDFALEGVLFAAAVGGRTAVLVTAATLLLLTTHPGKLLAALSAKGMPPKIAYVISSTLQMLPTFRTRADSILLAQRSRGLKTGGNPIRRFAGLVPLISPLVLGVFVDVDERSTAMEARAFGSTARRTALDVLPDPVPERVGRWVVILLASAALVASFAGFFPNWSWPL